MDDLTRSLLEAYRAGKIDPRGLGGSLVKAEYDRQERRTRIESLIDALDRCRIEAALELRATEGGLLPECQTALDKSLGELLVVVEACRVEKQETQAKAG